MLLLLSTLQTLEFQTKLVHRRPLQKKLYISRRFGSDVYSLVHFTIYYHSTQPAIRISAGKKKRFTQHTSFVPFNTNGADGPYYNKY